MAYTTDWMNVRVELSIGESLFKGFFCLQSTGGDAAGGHADMYYGEGRLPGGIPNILSLMAYRPETPHYLLMIGLIHAPAFLFPLSLFLSEKRG